MMAPLPMLKLILVAVLFLTSSCGICHIAGCNQTPGKQLYENPKAGISLVKPESWEISYSERNGITYIGAENGFWEKDSVRIQIHGPACGFDHPWYKDPYEELESNIDRLRILNGLDAVAIVLEPIELEDSEYTIVKAIIRVPEKSIKDDPNSVRVGNQEPDEFQTIELFSISDDKHFIMAYIYPGNNDELNSQAQDIIDSLQLACQPEP